jgi:predicted RNase H-like HicB family nuclease
MIYVIYQSLEYYLNLKYAFFVYPEATGLYSIVIPELPGCMSQGQTLEEAVNNLKKARQVWITTAWISGNKIPLPNHYSTTGNSTYRAKTSESCYQGPSSRK